MRSGKGGKRPSYGSGRRIDSHGYVQVWAPGHPVSHRDGYALEHRLVAYEAGLLTNLADHVHHGPGGKQDNRLENLCVLTSAEHQRLHHEHEVETYDRMRARVRAELGQRSCEICGNDITARRIDAVVCGNTCRVARWKQRPVASVP